MNRALKILSVAVILFLAYMWVSILYKSCNKNSEFEDFQDNVSLDKEVPSLPTDVQEDEFFQEEEITDTEDETKTSPIDYKELDSKIEKTTQSINNESNKTSTQNRKVTDTGVSGGKYMVIAGSYLLETNANEMLEKLNGMGYTNAEKVIFDQSQFHSVCAGRFDDYTKAVQVKSELSRRGVDNYIHTKK